MTLNVDPLMLLAGGMGRTVVTSGFPFFPQAADEPAYLTVGTDVSAKYRGAFCEAKIKTVKRLVKVKVKLCRLLRQPRLSLLLSLENRQVHLVCCE